MRIKPGDSVWYWAGERGEPVRKERGLVIQSDQFTARVRLDGVRGVVTIELRRLEKDAASCE